MASGVFTVLLAIGLTPRFAGKTGTADKILFYENSIIAGTVFLVIALLGLWRHFFTMTICYAAAVLVSEEKRVD